MKLLLTSFWTSPEQDAELLKLVGKPAESTRVAYIENAHDVYDDEASLIEGRAVLRNKGFIVNLVDLRDWLTDQTGLRTALEANDVFWLTGGNPYYLRWLMKATGADEIMTGLVERGTVYVGASAAAVVAGPTLRFFDTDDDPNEAPEVIWDGLNLTSIVLVPHVDNADFGAGCRHAGEQLAAAGYTTQWITDSEAFLINGDDRRVI